jgi:hypothetical protein
MHAKAKLRVAINIIIDEDTVCSDIGNVGCRQTKNDVARVGRHGCGIVTPGAIDKERPVGWCQMMGR